MPYFNDEQEVYRYLGQLFLDLLADEELAPQFRTANTVVQYRYHKPESQITVKLLEAEDGQVDLGETLLKPEVIMTMDADIAHRFWLGKVNVTMALARGQIKAKGRSRRSSSSCRSSNPCSRATRPSSRRPGATIWPKASGAPAPTDSAPAGAGSAGVRRGPLAWRSPPMTARWRASRAIGWLRCNPATAARAWADTP